MKKILSIVLLSVVMLSIVIVPSFAITQEDINREAIENQLGVEGYYTLNLNGFFNYDGISVNKFSSDLFASGFLYYEKPVIIDPSYDDRIYVIPATLEITRGLANIIYVTFDVDLYERDYPSYTAGSYHFERVMIYSDSPREYKGMTITSNILSNIEQYYDYYSTYFYDEIDGEIIYDDQFTEWVPYNVFLKACTTFAKSTFSPFGNPDIEMFLQNNATYTAADSFMDITPLSSSEIVIEETGNVFTSVISWAGSFVNTVFNNTGLLVLFLLGVGISIVLVVIRILRKVMWSK